MIKVIPYPLIVPGPRSHPKWSTYFVESTAALPTGDFKDTYIDDNDNVYATGFNVNGFFPVTPGALYGFNQGMLGTNDATVVKFKPDRSREFATYYGGSSSDVGNAITVDGNHDVIFTGYTFSSTTFPQCANPICNGYTQPFGGLGGTTDAFVVKLDATGQTVLMSTFYGGSGDEIARSIAVDASNNFVIAGWSTDNVPCPPAQPCTSQTGFYHSHNGMNDGFIAKFDVNNELDWATQLGGSYDDQVTGVCTDSDANIYVCGGTLSSATAVLSGPLASYTGTAFPICTPSDPCAGAPYVTGHSGSVGVDDHFVGKFRGSDNKLMWSTEFGGTGIEGGVGPGEIGASPLTNDIYITGGTFSSDFPIVSSPTGNYNDASLSFSDAYIARFKCYTLEWCTYYGGTDVEGGSSVAINNNGDVYFGGTTSSNNLTLLQTQCQPFYDDDLNDGVITTVRDGYLLKFDADDNSIYHTYLGGSNDDWINAIACQKNGHNIVVTGSTSSSMAQDFPLWAFNAPAYYQDQLPAGTHPYISNLLDCDNWRIGLSNSKSTKETIISLFPNPTGGTIFISSSGNEITRVQITDITGKVVFSNADIFVNLYECDLSMLPDGIYFTGITVDKTIYHNKIIK